MRKQNKFSKEQKEKILKINFQIGDLVSYRNDKETRRFLKKTLTSEELESDDALNLGIITRLITLQPIIDEKSLYANVYWILEDSIGTHLLVNLQKI